MYPLITIIIPVYKTKDYLRKCIFSVVEQTYTNLEIILVDDGSPDESYKVYEAFAKVDFRIKVIKKENGGLSSARNVGLDMARGKYIFFLDSDDYLDKNAIMYLYQRVKDTHSDMAVCNFTYVDENDCVMEVDIASPIKNEILSGNELLYKIAAMNGYYYSVPWNKLYKREIFDDVRFEVGKIHEDEFIIHKISSRCRRVACLDMSLYFYLQRRESIMGQKVSIKNLDGVEALMRRICFLSKSTDRLLKEANDIFVYSLWEKIFCFCEMFGFDNKELNNKMWSMKSTSIEYIPILLKDKSRCIKERIALSVLLLSPRTYKKIFVKNKH